MTDVDHLFTLVYEAGKKAIFHGVLSVDDLKAYTKAQTSSDVVVGVPSGTGLEMKTRLIAITLLEVQSPTLALAMSGANSSFAGGSPWLSERLP